MPCDGPDERGDVGTSGQRRKWIVGAITVRGSMLEGRVVRREGEVGPRSSLERREGFGESIQ